LDHAKSESFALPQSVRWRSLRTHAWNAAPQPLPARRPRSVSRRRMVSRSDSQIACEQRDEAKKKDQFRRKCAASIQPGITFHAPPTASGC
jgi:hypothetical protein